MGSKLKKDPEQIDKEDANAIKKMQGLEPRKKYALVHEDIGIFIIGIRLSQAFSFQTVVRI